MLRCHEKKKSFSKRTDFHSEEHIPRFLKNLFALEEMDYLYAPVTKHQGMFVL